MLNKQILGGFVKDAMYKNNCHDVERMSNNDILNVFTDALELTVSALSTDTDFRNKISQELATDLSRRDRFTGA